jgi:LCP family protein required for cell wall assembly
MKDLGAKITIAILLVVFVVFGVLFISSCTPKTEVTPSSTTSTIIVLPTSQPTGTYENPATPRQGQPTLVPYATPWTFSTPFWDNTNLRWPYGISGMAIPVESTFSGSVKVYVALGSDWMPHRNENQDLTDVIMLVLVDTENNRATIIGVPRDLYVFVPGFGMSRINVAWSLGDFNTFKETIRYNFGLDVDGIVYVRMYAFEKLIDQGLGGISVYVNWPIVERCGDLEINLLPGLVTMDGEHALCYARARMMTSDLDRMRRQQELLLAIKTRFLDIASEAPVEFAQMLYTVYVDSGFRTDISLLDVPMLVSDVLEIPETDFRFHRMDAPMLEHFDHPESGAWLWQMPNPEDMYSYIIQVMEK